MQTEQINIKNDTSETKQKFSLSNIFKRKNKTETTKKDSSENKKKFSLKQIFKRKNSPDSINAQADSSANDSAGTHKRFRIFGKHSDDTVKTNNIEKPQRISPGTWNTMSAEQQDSLLRAWDEYDKEHYKKKYAFTQKEKECDMKRDKTLTDKLILKKAANKPYKYKRKLINRKIKRYRKTMLYERFDKSETAPSDSLSDAKRYQLINKQYKREAKQEAIRKNKVILKFDRKEERLRRRYKLTDNEMIILNKGKGMPLKGSEKIIYAKARKKQEKFTEKLLKLRRKRSFKLQNKEVRKRIKAEKKEIKKRDKAEAKKLKKKKRDKEKNKKHDSSEYPKRYF
ncbi:MAG: hypothetical protein GXO50_02985 [Chlorobi bacterium]|nr:hypothetical protein [Chlorobiota bacterium]